MKTKELYILAVFFCLTVSCESWNDDVNGTKKAVNKELLGGYVQKGPFINGSSVAIMELDILLNQTGRSYSTIVVDNSGNFEQKNIGLASRYAQFKADGYYFNEVTGKTSIGQISLCALADVSETDFVNINVLTHLERTRVEYLVKEANKPFPEAKIQAQKEVLDIFSLDMAASPMSESLNLTDNALLLAVSCILQGPLAVGNMVELMSNISLDIRTDGKLDNPALGSRLVDNATVLSLPDIRKNMEDKYAEMNSAITVPDFERHVRQFLENTPYKQTTFITYPKQGAHGDNVLSEEINSVIAGQSYSMAAVIPDGFSLKVILKGGLWYYSALPGPVNWQISAYDSSIETQELVTIESGKTSDLSFWPGHGLWNEADKKYYTTIEYYENNAKDPVRTKRLEIITLPDNSGEVDSTMIFDNGNHWTNETRELHSHNKEKIGITEGIWGTLVKTEENCLPPVDANSACDQYPVIREIAIYEYTTVDKTKYSGNAFSEISTKLIATTTCDEEGFFELALPPGRYSVFVKENGYLYANRFDGKAGIAPVTVESSVVSEFNLNLLYRL